MTSDDDVKRIGERFGVDPAALKHVLAVSLGSVYVHRETGHRVRAHHFEANAGRVNERVVVRNLTTCHNETWSVRLFLADHEKEAR